MDGTQPTYPLDARDEQLLQQLILAGFDIAIALDNQLDSARRHRRGGGAPELGTAVAHQPDCRRILLEHKRQCCQNVLNTIGVIRSMKSKVISPAGRSRSGARKPVAAITSSASNVSSPVHVVPRVRIR